MFSEKLAMTEEFKEEVRLENKKKKLDATKNFYGNQHVVSTPTGVHSKKTRSNTWTDAQTSKKAGRDREKPFSEFPNWEL